MGLFRKITSISTLGLVDLRSDKERIAKNTKRGYKAQQEANVLSAQQLAAQQSPIRTQTAAAAPNPKRDAHSLVEDLTGLAQLRDSGVLSEAEFEAQKVRILSTSK
jgi:hypothetical protein